MSRSTVVVLALAGLGACLPRSTYTACKTDSDCASAGPGPRCESNGACSVSDTTCPSGHRYGGSAPQANTCVPGDAYDAPLADAPAGPPPPPGRECVQGGPLGASYSACAAKVDGKEPRCGTEMWNEVCVRWAETQCQLACSQMAFVGANDQPFVIRLRDNAILWQDDTQNSDGAPIAAWADFDNDGDPDLAVVGDTLLRIFRNDGYDDAGGQLVLVPIAIVDWGTISPQYPELNGTDVHWVDYDHDGDLDAVFAGFGGVVVLRNDGDGVFVTQTPIWQTVAGADSDADPAQPNVVRTAWGDYDGDGWPDLAIARFGFTDMIWHNDHGTISDSGWAPASTDAPAFGGGLEWCNLDDDPYPELATSGYSYVAIVNNADGVMSTTLTPLDSDDDTSDVQCGDFDGDGDLDLVASGDQGSPSRAYRNAGSITTFTQTWVDSNAATDKRYAVNAGVGDVDGDHQLDFMVSFDDTNAPVELQVFHDASITDKIQFTPTTHTVLSAQVQAGRSIALAPAIGKP